MSPPDRSSKTDTAFRTIGEVSRETGLPHHILRYWETRFPQLRPLTRAGNRRYYRAADVALVQRIDQLLRGGFTIGGVQKVLAGETEEVPPSLLETLRTIRAALAEALAADGV